MIRNSVSNHLITVSTKKLSVILKTMKQIGKITTMLILIILTLRPTFRESAPYTFISTLKSSKPGMYLCTIAGIDLRLESLSFLNFIYSLDAVKLHTDWQPRYH